MHLKGYILIGTSLLTGLGDLCVCGRKGGGGGGGARAPPKMQSRA